MAYVTPPQTNMSSLIDELQVKLLRLEHDFDNHKMLMDSFVMGAIDKHQFTKLNAMLWSSDEKTKHMARKIIVVKNKAVTDALMEEMPILLDVPPVEGSE
jgi:hypothetical protein